MTKAGIRAQIAVRRKSFQCLEKLSRTVLEKLRGLEIFRQAKSVGTYMPLADEVDTTPVFQCLEKKIFIPAFDEALGSYRMARYTPELKKGRFGIPEPENPVWAGPDELDLILIPGIAFDRAGGRLGRGGGFYDRLLPQYRTTRFGICFSFQILEKIPSEPHDCLMDFLVTDAEILKIAMNG
jgi:5-formyltetrahydrofolate cyclo-ligase